MANKIAASGPTLPSDVYARRLRESASGATLASEAIQTFRKAHGGSPTTSKEIILASRTAAETQGLTGREQLATAAILAKQAESRAKPEAPLKTASQIISDAREIAQLSPRAYYPAVASIAAQESFKEKTQALQAEENAIYAGRAPKASGEILREARKLSSDTPESFYGVLGQVAAREKAAEPIYGFNNISGKASSYATGMSLASAASETTTDENQPSKNWEGYVGNYPVTKSSGLKGFYQEAEQQFRERITYPAARRLRDLGLTEANTRKFFTLTSGKGITKLYPESERAAAEKAFESNIDLKNRFVSAAGVEIREYPFKTGLIFSGGAIIGQGLTMLAGSKLALSSRAAYNSINWGMKTVAVGSGLVSVGMIGAQLQKYPDKKPEILGQSAVNIGAGLLGGYLGSKSIAPYTFLNRRVISTPAQTETIGTVTYKTKVTKTELQNPFKRITDNILPATSKSATFRESEIPLKSIIKIKTVTGPEKMTYIRTGKGYYEEGMRIGTGNLNIETVRPIGKDLYVLKSTVTSHNKITTNLFTNKKFIAKFSGIASDEFVILEPRTTKNKVYELGLKEYPYTTTSKETIISREKGLPVGTEYLKTLDVFTRQDVSRTAKLTSPPTKITSKLSASELGELQATPTELDISRLRLRFSKGEFKLKTTTQEFKGQTLKENIRATFTTTQEIKQLTKFYGTSDKDIFVNPRFYSGVSVFQKPVLTQTIPKINLMPKESLIPSFTKSINYKSAMTPLFFVAPRLSSISKGISRTETQTIPSFKIEPATSSITLTGLKPKTAQEKISIVLPRTTSTGKPIPEKQIIPGPEPTFTPWPGPSPKIPLITPFIIPDSGLTIGRNFDKSFKLRQTKKYTPTLQATVFKISGKPNKFAVATGLGQRPLLSFKMPKIKLSKLKRGKW